MSIALISSLYRSEKHLPTFTAAVFGFARQVSERGIEAHYLPIVNDASPREWEQINHLAQEINGHYYGRMTPHYVPRETLYASWNRAISLSPAACFAPWNADDIRFTDAFIEGYTALQDGADLVDFPFTRIMLSKRLGILPRAQRIHAPCPFDNARFTRRNGLGTFFMARKSLYEKLGPFDANFRVAGDTEWASRDLSTVKFQQGRAIGGEFLVHGGNLSNSRSEQEDIEVNLIFMRRGDWHHLRPANPRLMRETWETWGNPERIALPAEVADFLWGADAEARWQRYQRERRQPPALRRLRLSLASRGLLYSEEWAMAQRGRDPQ